MAVWALVSAAVMSAGGPAPAAAGHVANSGPSSTSLGHSLQKSSIALHYTFTSLIYLELKDPTSFSPKWIIYFFFSLLSRNSLVVSRFHRSVGLLLGSLFPPVVYLSLSVLTPPCPTHYGFMISFSVWGENKQVFLSFFFFYVPGKSDPLHIYVYICVYVYV